MPYLTNIMFATIRSDNVFYPSHRDNPCFPTPNVYDNVNGTGGLAEYYYDTTRKYSYLSCIDLRYLCDHDRDKCWRIVGHPLQLRDIRLGARTGEAERVYVLLYIALSHSTMLLNSGNLEASSHVRGAVAYDLPPEQWKVEVKQWFDASLTVMQLVLLDLVQKEPTHQEQKEDSMPADFQEICHMVKFRAAGWRNVSAWGLLSLLSLSAIICLGSKRTANKELWLMVGLGLVGRMLLWILSKIQRLPWNHCRVYLQQLCEHAANQAKEYWRAFRSFIEANRT